MSDLAVDLDSFAPSEKSAIIKELVTGHQMRMVQSEINQRKIAKENQSDHRSINGFGRLVARFDYDGYISNFVRKGEAPLKHEDVALQLERCAPKWRSTQYDNQICTSSS